MLSLSQWGKYYIACIQESIQTGIGLRYGLAMRTYYYRIVGLRKGICDRQLEKHSTASSWARPQGNRYTVTICSCMVTYICVITCYMQIKIKYA